MTVSLRLTGIVALLLHLSLQAAIGQEKKPEPVESEAPAAILKSPIGTLLIGADESKQAWQLPALFDYVPLEKTLIALPGSRAVVDLPRAGAQLILWGNLPELSPSPVLQCVARLRAEKGADAELSLVRGRIMLENTRKEGPVKARIHLAKEQLDVTLATPKSAIVLERFQPWIAGVPFAIKPKTPRMADAHVALLVVKGKVEITRQGETHHVQEPAAFVGVGSGRLQGPSAVNKLPDWLWPNTDLSEKATAWHKGVETLRRQFAAKKGVGSAVTATAGSKQAHARAVAVLSAAAVGNLPAVLAGWRDKSAEVRLAATRALQNRISAGSEEDLELYHTLLEAKYPAGQAQTIMELLHGFSSAALTRPETYEILINYLQHQQPAIRELAAWNLYTLVPQGKSIPYDAAASQEERARSQAAWRKLVPEGKVPPRDGD
ncbi:MAG: hypothetical protein FJ271_26005 [Planctomycetes bacterium]|nr:hypothetical protein [Planctomycetota bacterium]